MERLETISPPQGSRVLSIRCPNSYYAYPAVDRVERIPEAASSVLESIWTRSIHPGQPVEVFHLRDVYTVKEGLVFDENGRLFDLTRTYHSDEEVAQGRDAVGTALMSNGAPTFERGILAKSLGCKNYGHFVLEMLPRAWVAREIGDVTDWPVVVDNTSTVMETVARQALDSAGFAPEQVVAIDEAPTFFKELLVVGGLTAHSQYISPFVMQCHDAIAAAVPAGSARAIYAPRRPATWRDFEDEADVAAMLGRLGFDEVRAGELSFQEQIAAFKGAEAVVGISGAALSNIAFCKPGTTVFCFTPCSALEVLFWMIAQARRLDYREIRCAEIGPCRGALPWDRTIQISLREIKRQIDKRWH